MKRSKVREREAEDVIQPTSAARAAASRGEFAAFPEAAPLPIVRPWF